jgi:predicted transcriptional regulator
MQKEKKWDDVGYVIASSYRSKVLHDLETPKTPSHLSKNLNINKTHISRALSELEAKDLIECLTPKVKKGKLYVISSKGKRILKETQSI